MHTACVWSEKLPFAGYSVVKDHSGGIRPSESHIVVLGTTSPGPPSLGRSQGPKAPLRSLASILQRPARLFAAAISGELGLSGGPSEPGARQSRASKQSGEYRARTGDLLVANQALSQLS